MVMAVVVNAPLMMMMMSCLQNTTSNVSRSASTLPAVSAVKLTTPTSSYSLSADNFTTSVRGKASCAPGQSDGSYPSSSLLPPPPQPGPALPHPKPPTYPSIIFSVGDFRYICKVGHAVCLSCQAHDPRAPVPSQSPCPPVTSPSPSE